MLLLVRVMAEPSMSSDFIGRKVVCLRDRQNPLDHLFSSHVEWACPLSLSLSHFIVYKRERERRNENQLCKVHEENCSADSSWHDISSSSLSVYLYNLLCLYDYASIINSHVSMDCSGSSYVPARSVHRPWRPQWSARRCGIDTTPHCCNGPIVDRTRKVKEFDMFSIFFSIVNAMHDLIAFFCCSLVGAGCTCRDALAI